MSPYVTVAIVLVVILVITSGYAYLANKGQSREAAMNQQIAQQAGMRYIHRPLKQPSGMFDIYDRRFFQSSHYAIDPATNEWSMQAFYNIPPTGIHHRNDQGESMNVSVASVNTDFWIVYNIVIFPKPRIGRFKGRYLTGNEEFDKKWVVGSMDPSPLPAIITPGVINALMHPPFEFNKKTEITFRGPQMLIETNLVEFEKRIQLLRWCQNLVKQVDLRNAPYHGAFTATPQHTTDNELPWTMFDYPDGSTPGLGDNIGTGELTESSDAEA